MPRQRRSRTGDRGATLVEFALILPILMALILGMITGGLAYNRKISMTNAVREGTRYGATIAYSSSIADDVATRVQEVSGGEIGPSDVCVRVGTPSVIRHEYPSAGCPAALGPAPSNPAATPANACLIKVWSYRAADLQVIFFKTTLNLTSSAIARYERGECA